MADEAYDRNDLIYYRGSRRCLTIGWDGKFGILVSLHLCLARSGLATRAQENRLDRIVIPPLDRSRASVGLDYY